MVAIEELLAKLQTDDARKQLILQAVEKRVPVPIIHVEWAATAFENEDNLWDAGTLCAQTGLLLRAVDDFEKGGYPLNAGYYADQAGLYERAMKNYKEASYFWRAGRAAERGGLSEQAQQCYDEAKKRQQSDADFLMLWTERLEEDNFRLEPVPEDLSKKIIEDMIKDHRALRAYENSRGFWGQIRHFFGGMSHNDAEKQLDERIAASEYEKDFEHAAHLADKAGKIQRAQELYRKAADYCFTHMQNPLTAARNARRAGMHERAKELYTLAADERERTGGFDFALDAAKRAGLTERVILYEQIAGLLKLYPLRIDI
ncbi:hypothetical protein HY639_05660 [Candidatus Woesearchaeota archaeon]|nr:hypothetical protein [Candidatus Woesearchaeota archaeon]